MTMGCVQEKSPCFSPGVRPFRGNRQRLDRYDETYYGYTYYGYTYYGCTYYGCTYYGCTYYGNRQRLDRCDEK